MAIQHVSTSRLTRTPSGIVVPSTPWALGCWARVTDASAQAVAASFSRTDDGSHITLGFYDTGQWRFRMRSVATGGTFVEALSASDPGADGLWRLVVGVCEGSTLRLYFCLPGQAPTLEFEGAVVSNPSCTPGHIALGRMAGGSSTLYWSPNEMCHAFGVNGLVTAAMVEAIAAAIDPSTVGSLPPLLFHAPLATSSDASDSVGGGAFAVSGSPLTVDGPQASGGGGDPDPDPPEGAAITGVVTAGGDPAAGWRVRALAQGTDDTAATATTAADGSYVLGGLVDGQAYEVHATKVVNGVLVSSRPRLMVATDVA